MSPATNYRNAVDAAMAWIWIIIANLLTDISAMADVCPLSALEVGNLSASERAN